MLGIPPGTLQRTLAGVALGALSVGSACDSPAGANGVPVVLLNGTIQSVSVEPSSITIKVGQLYKLNAGISATPGAITSYNVFWSSADPQIANVNDAGVVEANSPGMTTITAASVVIPNIVGTAAITVVK